MKECVLVLMDIWVTIVHSVCVNLILIVDMDLVWVAVFVNVRMVGLVLNVQKKYQLTHVATLHLADLVALDQVRLINVVMDKPWLHTVVLVELYASVYNQLLLLVEQYHLQLTA